MRIIPEMSAKQQDHFWSKVDRRGADECWPWLALTNNEGYGVAFINRVQYRSHRVSMALDGRDPLDLFGCHTCDNPPCCNPRHLFAGSQLDNMGDCAAKGRSAIGARNGTYTMPERTPRGDTHYSRVNPELVKRGERCWNSKLTAVQIVAILADTRTQRAIAAAYGVGESQISRIKNGRRWAHVVGKSFDPALVNECRRVLS